MLIVSNTSPINYLVLIEAVEVLPALHQRVAIPVAVLEELRAAATPGAVRAWARNPPQWLEILRPTSAPDERLAQLGRGERGAILLAQELNATLVIDEVKAYREAKRRNIPTLRTLGILDMAAERGLIDLTQAVERLRQTNFRVRPEILDQLLERQGARSGPPSESTRKRADCR
jgi:predicted nucleic acid-binding protein